MSARRRKPGHPGFIVLREVRKGRWEMVGEVKRRPGLTARDARTLAVVTASKGRAKPGEVFAAILRSEWRLALDWKPL